MGGSVFPERPSKQEPERSNRFAHQARQQHELAWRSDENLIKPSPAVATRSSRLVALLALAVIGFVVSLYARRRTGQGTQRAKCEAGRHEAKSLFAR